MEPPTFIPSSKPNPYLTDSSLILVEVEQEREEEENVLISTSKGLITLDPSIPVITTDTTTLATLSTLNSTVPVIDSTPVKIIANTSPSTSITSVNSRITLPNSLPFPSPILSISPPKVNLTYKTYRQYPIKESAERSTVHSIPNAITHSKHYNTSSSTSFLVEIPYRSKLASTATPFVRTNPVYTKLPTTTNITNTTHRKPSLVKNSLSLPLNTSDLSSLSSNSSSSSRESSPDRASSSAKTIAVKNSNKGNLMDMSDSEEEEEDNSDYEDEDGTMKPKSNLPTSKAATTSKKGKGKEKAVPAPTKGGKTTNVKRVAEDDAGGNKKKKVSKGPLVISIKDTNTSLIRIGEKEPQVTTNFKPPSKYLLQTGRCLNRSYSLHQSCAACISRYSGYTCSFINIRSFPYTHLAIIPAGDIFFLTAPDVNATPEEGGESSPNYPIEFNQIFKEKEHATRIKTCVAETFIKFGTLQQEIAHFDLNKARDANPVRVKRELGVRSTCDGCFTGIFSGSWLCTNCGKEICLDCAEVLRGLGTTQEEIEAANKKSHLNAEVVRKLTNCCKPRDGPLVKHTITDFVPFTRTTRFELAKLLGQMETWLKTHKSDKIALDPEVLAQYLKDPGNEIQFQEGYGYQNEKVIKGFYVTSTKETHPYVRVPFSDISPQVILDDIDYDPFFNPKLTPAALEIIKNKTLASAVKSLQNLEISTSELFRALWSRGEPMVVDVMGRYKLDWTPEMFTKEFGTQKCKIVSNLHANAEDRDATVGEFFAQFGKARKWEESEKIKDWPSTSDFKSEFPKLFKDFMNTIPVPSVTRRDGVLNIAAHTPLNWNPPDLGPKGYFSEVSYDTKGGSGSTKLHMDVADATNLMFWSGEDIGGKPGTAAWDLFRAEDTELIRDFLYSHMASYRGEHGKSVEELRFLYDDPIHGQSIYLDEDLRAKLLLQKGVKPFRIWQRPGQVVFIPAGCAHQVCNYADCIKIASDFVSIENVGRCWKITEEFRHQVKDRKKLWREDVLQLKAQLLWAWKSCARFD